MISVLKRVFLCTAVLATASAWADSTAKSLFDDVQELVYQIRVIDIASGDKYSIGSGFLVSDIGHVATNFHVVSSFVHEPEKFRLEYVRKDGTVAPLKLLAIDVVHDLAIAQSGESEPVFLPLAADDLSKGDRIYSVGNPLDLGMTIIEGTYNGLVEKSRYQKILFSGSLNAGMSGGPALNVRGEVVGVNVSKGGEQISFLVPVEYVGALLQQSLSLSEKRDFDGEITKALLADQQQFYDALLNSPTGSKALGKLRVPGKLIDSLNCWGHTVDEEDRKYEGVHQHCQSEDEIYISEDLYVGDFYYDYELISTDELNRFQFYHLLEEHFDHRTFANTRDKEQVTEFDCHSDVVELASGSWKISTCLRAYRRYKGLHDASMTMVSVDYNDLAAVVKVGATGVAAQNALAIFQHIAEAVEWKH